MIDKREKLTWGERKKEISLRKKIIRGRIDDFRNGVNQCLKNKGFLISQCFIVLLVIALFLQNSQTSSLVKKYLGESETFVHEIYDDSQVIEAYHSQDPSQLSSTDRFVYDTLVRVIDEVIHDGMTPYEKEKAIYDWQINWLNFSDDGLNPISSAMSADTSTPYGVFSSHQAICVGNATTFKLFMDALQIPCKIIHSTDNGEHAWDLVQLEDEWYHVDITFDNGTENHPTYAYFNVPDSIKDDGSWPWDHNQIPAANGTKYCYMFMNAKEVDDLYGIPAVINESLNQNENLVSIILKDRKGFNRTVADYMAGYFGSENGNLCFENAYALGGKTVYVFRYYQWGSDVNQIEPEVQSRLDQIINEILYGSLDWRVENGIDEDFSMDAVG